MPIASYASYVLRLRRVQDMERTVWVATTQSVGSGEERSFLSIEALAAFLMGEYAECSEGEGHQEANSSAGQE